MKQKHCSGMGLEAFPFPMSTPGSNLPGDRDSFSYSSRCRQKGTEPTDAYPSIETIHMTWSLYKQHTRTVVYLHSIAYSSSHLERLPISQSHSGLTQSLPPPQPLASPTSHTIPSRPHTLHPSPKIVKKRQKKRLFNRLKGISPIWGSNP
jgi:hypothetical protein